MANHGNQEVPPPPASSEPEADSGPGAPGPPVSPAPFLVALFFAPSLFFSRHFARDRKIYAAAAAFLVGLQTGVSVLGDQLRQALENGAADHPALQLGDWRLFWAASAVLAVILGLLHYYGGGWFYRKRAEWSGGAATPSVYRRLYIYTSLIPAAVVLLDRLRATLTFTNPLKSATESSWPARALAVLLLAALYWSVYASWRGVNLQARPSRRTMTLMWFVLLPAVWLTAVYLRR